MSRYGRKRCRVCGGIGHNRRTCPQLSDEAKEDRKKTINYYKELYGRKRKKVTCSQCGEEGHNRKTCPEYKELLAKCQDLNFRLADGFRKLMNKKGICQGAVILTNTEREIKGRGWATTENKLPVSYIVTEITYDFMELHYSAQPMILAHRIGGGELMGLNDKGESVPAKANDSRHFRVKAAVLGAATIEDLKQICDTTYVYPSLSMEGVVTSEDAEKIQESWKDHYARAEQSADSAMKTLKEGLESIVVIVPGYEPTKKIDSKTKKRLTSESKFSRLRIDGEEKNPFDKWRVERVERTVQFLEEKCK